MGHDKFFADAIAQLRDDRRYRVVRGFERIAGRFPHAIWPSPQGLRDVVIWCSNVYLGMGQHPKVIRAMVETACGLNRSDLSKSKRSCSIIQLRGGLTGGSIPFVEFAHQLDQLLEQHRCVILAIAHDDRRDHLRFVEIDETYVVSSQASH